MYQSERLHSLRDAFGYYLEPPGITRPGGRLGREQPSARTRLKGA
jgi:hypothetical protein